MQIPMRVLCECVRVRTATNVKRSKLANAQKLRARSIPVCFGYSFFAMECDKLIQFKQLCNFQCFQCYTFISTSDSQIQKNSCN